MTTIGANKKALGEKNSLIDKSTISIKTKQATVRKYPTRAGTPLPINGQPMRQMGSPHLACGRITLPTHAHSGPDVAALVTGSGGALTLAPTWSPPCSSPPERVAVSSQGPWILLRPSMSRGLTFLYFSSEYSTNMCFALLCRVEVLPSVETFINILIA